eukprot:scaffold24111_cov87-Cyclotella_meneghiniana.AAC.2
MRNEFQPEFERGVGLCTLYVGEYHTYRKPALWTREVDHNKSFVASRPGFRPLVERSTSLPAPMFSSDWLCGQIAFIYAFNKVRKKDRYSHSVRCFASVKPAQVVDKIVEIAVDILVPGRGAGEGNW